MIKGGNEIHIIFGVLDEHVEPKVYIHESVINYLNNKDIDDLMKISECIKDNSDLKIKDLLLFSIYFNNNDDDNIEMCISEKNRGDLTGKKSISNVFDGILEKLVDNNVTPQESDKYTSIYVKLDSKI